MITDIIIVVVCIGYRDKLLQDDDIDVHVGVLKNEDREEIIMRFYSKDIKYDESLAANRHLRTFFCFLPIFSGTPANIFCHC